MKSDEDLTSEFDVEEIVGEPPPPSWNVAPTANVRIIARRKPHGHSDDPEAKPLVQLRTARWGLIPSWTKPPVSSEKGLVPSWAKDRRTQGRLFNARSESLATTGAFRNAYARRRCLVPADGWFEWQVTDGPTKQPLFMTPADGHPLAFAGLYEFWRDPSDAAAATLTTCTIVTAAAQGALADVHDRMPLTLARADWARWLDPSVTDPADLLSARDEAAAEHLELRPVATLVNKVDNNGAELVERTEPLPIEQKLF